MAAGFAESRRQGLFDSCAGKCDEVGECAVEGEDAAGEDAAGQWRGRPSTCTGNPPS